MQTRKIKRGVAKDYQRNAKNFEYFSICVKKTWYNLQLGGWSEGLVVKRDRDGSYVEIEDTKYYLDFSNLDKQ